jgi:hypothetical protein
LFKCNKKGEVFTPRPFYNISLLLNWRETSSNSIVAELLHARIHTTRKAETRKELVASFAHLKRARLADDVGEGFLTAVGFVFD